MAHITANKKQKKQETERLQYVHYTLTEMKKTNNKLYILKYTKYSNNVIVHCVVTLLSTESLRTLS